MSEKKKSWESELGKASNARVVNLWSYLMAFGLSCLVVYLRWEPGIILPLGFIGVSSGFKYGEKRVENKQEK